MGGGVRVGITVGVSNTFFVALSCRLVSDDLDPRKTTLMLPDITPCFAKSHRSKILVADDNPANRKLARLLLQEFGHTTDEAEDGFRAALTKNKRYIWDVS